MNQVALIDSAVRIAEVLNNVPIEDRYYVAEIAAKLSERNQAIRAREEAEREYQNYATTANAINADMALKQQQCATNSGGRLGSQIGQAIRS
jgi:hypothetical protein